MRRNFIVAVLCWLSLLPFPGHAQMGMMKEGGMMNMSMRRHHFVMMNGIDQRYASKKSPVPNTTENISAGRRLYEQNCALCHGSKGLGDGEAGKSLEPRPANIAAFSKMPMATDGYLYWTISEGGVPVGSQMPPFKNSLKEGEIWRIILYVRGL